MASGISATWPGGLSELLAQTRQGRFAQETMSRDRRGSEPSASTGRDTLFHETHFAGLDLPL